MSAEVKPIQTYMDAAGVSIAQLATASGLDRKLGFMCTSRRLVRTFLRSRGMDMNNRFRFMLELLLVAACAFSQNSRTIQVDIAYTGSGTLDANHKIYVALWNSALRDGAPPVA